MTPWRLELGGLAALVLISLLAVGNLLEPGTAPYSPHSDIVAAHLTIKHALYESWQAGHGIPFWRSDMLSGGPGLTHPQTLYTNPFHFLFFVLPAVDAMGPTVWLHYLTMAVAYSILGRALGLGIWPRLFMAIAALFSFKLVAITYAGWLSVMPMVTFLPLLLAAVLHLIDRPRLSAALGLAAVGTLCLHSGHLQLFYYALVFLAPYFAWCAASALRGGESTRGLHTLGLGLLAAVIAAAASAYLLVPLAAEAPLTSRAEVTYEFFLAGRQAVPIDLTTFLHPEAVGTPLDGGNFEIWEHTAYFGAIPELLAIVGIVLGRRRKHAWLLIAGFAGSVVLAFDSPLNRLLYEFLPGYSLFRCPNRFFFVSSLFGLGLAGIGLAEVAARSAQRPIAPALRRAIPALLIALTAAEGAYYANRYVTTAASDVVVPTPHYRAFLEADDSIHRIAPLRRATINYGWASSMGLELITGYEPYNYAHYQLFFDVLRKRIVEFVAPAWTDLRTMQRGDILDVLNVRYLAASEQLDVPDGYRLEARWSNQPRFIFYNRMGAGEIFLYRNENAFDRAFWAPAVMPALDIQHAASLARRHSLRRVAIVESPDLSEVVHYPADGGKVAIAKPHTGALRIETSNSEAGFLVVSEVWHPGWRVTLDGTRVAFHRTDLALMGIDVPAGPHEITLEFRPLHWETSLAISAAGWTVLALLFGWNLARSRLRT